MVVVGEVEDTGGVPRFSTGPSLSSGACSVELFDAPSGDVWIVVAAGEVEVGFDEGEPAGTFAAVVLLFPGVAPGDEDEAPGASGGWGLAAPERRRTGGPSSTFIPLGSDDSAFFGTFAAAASALADCHLPSPIHSFVSFRCNAPVTVNNPCETPVRIPS